MICENGVHRATVSLLLEYGMLHEIQTMFLEKTRMRMKTHQCEDSVWFLHYGLYSIREPVNIAMNFNGPKSPFHHKKIISLSKPKITTLGSTAINTMFQLSIMESCTIHCDQMGR
jgi:hypothetical protein